MRTLRPVLAVVVMAAAVAFSLAGGAGSGSGATTFPCPPDSGRQFCVTITDTEPVSASVGGVVAYVLYTISVDNVGGATLTNGVVTTTLKDHVGTTTSKSSAQFIASASTLGCAAVSGPTNAVSCNVGNLAAGTVARVAAPARLQDVDDDQRRLDRREVVGSFKEKGNDNQNNDPNPDTRPVVENTPYESCDDCSRCLGAAWPAGEARHRTRRGHVGDVHVHEQGSGRPDDARRDSPRPRRSSSALRGATASVSSSTRTSAPSRSTGCWRGRRRGASDVVAPGVNDRNVVIVHTPAVGATPEVISRNGARATRRRSPTCRRTGRACSPRSAAARKRRRSPLAGGARTTASVGAADR